MTSDLTFPCMGSQFRLLVAEPVTGAPGPDDAARRARSALERFDHRLSRFRPDSELCALNADPRAAVPASPLVRGFVRAARWAAERTDGLVDPTLLDAIVEAGYRDSWSHATDVSLGEALAAAPPRRPARARADQRWRAVRVEGEAIVRPPGLALDSGGCGKGLAADAVARMLRDSGQGRFAVDCGGDLHVEVTDPLGAPWEIGIEHPMTGELIHTVRVRRGGVATSGLGARIWRTADGRCAHHLLDPSTGEPVWSGLIGATALGTDTLEAETLAKAALLSGAHVARRLLRERGGVLVHDDGDVELVGPVRARPRVRVTELGLEVAA
jgi:thiamine biosynthesis lipoprotein